MKPRQLHRLLSLPAKQRLPALAQGLDLLAQHVQVLADDVNTLVAQGRRRGSAVLKVQEEEEAAKILILMDLARLGVSDTPLARRQVQLFYDHLARGVYSYMAGMRPRHLHDVDKLADHLCASNYLDGPNDVDWVYRNRVLSEREDNFYVDYIATDEGDMWTNPMDMDAVPLGFIPGSAGTLALALTELGATSVDGLVIVGEVWSNLAIVDWLEWNAVDRLNQEVLSRLLSAGLGRSTATERHARIVQKSWGFPLYAIDLKERKIPISQLRTEQERRLAKAAGGN